MVCPLLRPSPQPTAWGGVHPHPPPPKQAPTRGAGECPQVTIAPGRSQPLAVARPFAGSALYGCSLCLEALLPAWRPPPCTVPYTSALYGCRIRARWQEENGPSAVNRSCPSAGSCRGNGKLPFPPTYIARRAAVRYTQREERYARSERGAVYAGSRVRVPNAAVHRRRTRAIGSAAPRQRLVPSTFQLPLTFAVTPPPPPPPPLPPPPPPAVRDRKGSRMPRAGEGRAGGGPLRLPSRHEARGTRPSEALEQGGGP